MRANDILAEQQTTLGVNRPDTDRGTGHESE